MSPAIKLIIMPQTVLLAQYMNFTFAKGFQANDAHHQAHGKKEKRLVSSKSSSLRICQ